MPLAVDGYVQTNADGVGKRVRNVTLYALQADGSIQTVYQQVVAIADAATGQPLDIVDEAAWRGDVTMLLRGVVRGLAILAETTEEELLGEDDSDL